MKPVLEWGMWLLIRASMLKEGLYVKNEEYEKDWCQSFYWEEHGELNMKAHYII